ncbi:hypothetical protein B0T17DRAFT_621070 [Bombardia bombarda]|uniref:DUF1996 domain-containing protein n=1 Tax=Bombardia bombarda TaxID=252184 RepID=A0AA39W9V2_9PEZI|nr:hypothetical protein B0T17DRAFT_621070 [Bombardia bombarda]
MKLSITVGVVLVPNALAAGVLRFGCSQITVERLDPLVTPGQAPSPHIHQVVGGNAFNTSITAHADVSSLASCTTCSFSEDLSNYWTANVYFRARNGSYKRVPQVPNRFLDGATAGMTVYYFPEDLRSKVTAFPPGFRMLVGESTLRSAEGHVPKNCFRCFTGPNFEGDNAAPCQDAKLDTPYFPKTPCPGGIRTNVHFPTCWDGVTLDPPDHKSHVAFSSRGACPKTHPVKIPQVMLEVVWDTAGFNDKALWPEDGSQPFVLSTGDSTGYGQHADYVFGWKGDALQRAMDTASGCQAATCPTLKTQSFDVANSCVIKKKINEDIEGCELLNSI